MSREPDFRPGYLLPGEYVLEEFLGGGQDGEVWRALRRSLKKVCAAKFLNSVDDKDKKARFNTEIEILASLNHPNIISISDKHEASNPRTNKIVPFYVMEFLEAVSLDKYLDGCPTKRTFKVFCSLLEQAALALLEVHSKGLSHGDIKAANLMVVRKTGTAVLTDFGFGLRRGEQGVSRVDYPSSSYRSPKGLTAQQADVYRLGRTFLDALASIRARLTQRADSDLRELLAMLTEEPSDSVLERVMSRLENVSEEAAQPVPDELTTWIPELSTSARGSIVSDPIQGYVALTDRVRAIVDLPAFQRLRRLRELPESELVYPAMSQTRFECALGSFGQMVKYTRRLADLPEFRSATDAKDIGIALVGCLLTVLGQYPFSHIVQRPFPRNDALDPRVRSAHLVIGGPISEIVEKNWGFNAETVFEVLLGFRNHELRGVKRLVLDLLDGPVSARSVDQLLRTAWRAGMHHAFDEARLTHSIRISADKFCMVLPSERLPAYEDFLSAKYALAERVYSIPAARSARQMLAHSFFEIGNLEDLLDLNDDAFLETCVSRAKEKGFERALNLLRAYQRRTIYKRVENSRPGQDPGSRAGERWESVAFSGSHLGLGLAVDVSIEVENAFSQLCGHTLPPGSVVFDPGLTAKARMIMPVVSSTGELVTGEDASPTIRSILEAQRLLFTPSLFVSPSILAQLEKLGRGALHDTFHMIVERFRDH